MLCILGIVYAHRNEDIVNFGPGEKTKTSINQSESQAMPVVQRKEPNRVVKKQEVHIINERKRAQYRLLARSRGMEELEFSMWLLSATPGEREEVLQEYRRRKMR